MATQVVAIAKVIGPWATEALGALQVAAQLREGADSRWMLNEEGRAACDRIWQTVYAGRTGLPVIYYCEYVDHWSMGVSFEQTLGPHALAVETNEAQLWVCPLHRELRSAVESLSHAGQNAEDRLLGQQCLAALDAWSSVAPGGLLVVSRRVVGPTLDDAAVARCGSPSLQ